MGPQMGRWAGIDALRGVSVVLVVLHHLHLRFVLRKLPVAELWPRALSRVLFWSGYHAVITFFVISGFLIMSLSLRRWGRPGDLRLAAFYRLRAARILPCLLALLGVLSCLHVWGLRDYAIPPERASLARALLAALSFHVNWLEGARGYLPGSWDVLWSLSVEEAFYLVFPLLCLCARREAWLCLPLAALIGLGPLYRVQVAEQEPWADYAYLSCGDAIAFGCLAALVHARVRLGRLPLWAALGCGLALSAAVIGLRREPLLQSVSEHGRTVSVLALGVALMLVAFAGGLGAGLAPRATAWLGATGRSSYETYLSHMFVVFGSVSVFEWLGARVTGPVIALWYLATLALALALGGLIARVYSEPLNRRLRGRDGLTARAGWSRA